GIGHEIDRQPGHDSQLVPQAQGFNSAGLIKRVSVLLLHSGEYVSGPLAQPAAHECLVGEDFPIPGIDNRLEGHGEVEVAMRVSPFRPSNQTCGKMGRREESTHGRDLQEPKGKWPEGEMSLHRTIRYGIGSWCF